MNRVSGLTLPLDCRPNTLSCKPNGAQQSGELQLSPQPAHDTVRFSGLSPRGRSGLLALLLALTPALALVGCGMNSTEKTAIQQVDQSTQNDEQAKLLSKVLRQKGTWQGRNEALKRFNMLNLPAAVKMPAYLSVTQQLYEDKTSLNSDHFQTAQYLRTGLLTVARQPETSKEHAATITAFVANIPLVNPGNNAIDPVSEEYKALKATLQKAFPAPAEEK